MESPAKEPWYQRAWTVAWEKALGTVVTLALTALFAWLFKRSHSMPNALIDPAEYWLRISTVILCSFASVLSVVKAGMWGAGGLKRWRHPHSITVRPISGPFAGIEMTHFGEPANWEVGRRIIKTPDGYTNPDPLWHLCYLSKDGKNSRSLGLKAGESANVILAVIRHGEWQSGSWVSLR